MFKVIKNHVGNYQVVKEVDGEQFVYMTTSSESAAFNHKEELEALYK